MTRILHLLAPAAVGGLETVVEALAAGQQARGHRVEVGVVIEPERRDHPLRSRLEEAGIPVRPLVVPHRAYLKEMRAVASLLRRSDPEIVHTHGYRCDVVAGSVARWKGAPVVSTVHGFTRGGWRNRLYEGLQRWSLRGFDAVVAVSEPLAEELEEAGVGAGRLHVVRNAAPRSGRLLDREEARGRLGLPREAFVVGWVGRLSSEKGPDLFLEALARIDGNGLMAAIIGEGRQEADLRALAAKLRLGEAVQFCGRVPRAARLFPAFDVFVLSSRTEGTPMSLFEAMEAAVPIVATRVGGVPEVIDESEAWLVSPGDAEALAAGIRAVRDRPESAHDRAARARRRSREEFGVEAWLEQYEEVYTRVLERRKGGAA